MAREEVVGAQRPVRLIPALEALPDGEVLLGPDERGDVVEQQQDAAAPITRHHDDHDHDQ